MKKLDELICVFCSVIFSSLPVSSVVFSNGRFFFSFADKTEIALLLVSGTIVMRRGKTDIFVL